MRRSFSLGTSCALFLCFLFSLMGSVVSVVRFRQFDIFYYDFGIFDTAIWKVAHFKPPIIDHLLLGGKWIFADHFSPSIFLFSPLYWFTSSPEILLVAQAVCVGLSGFVLYTIGQQVLRKAFPSLAVVISYFLFVGLQNAIIADFHEITVAVLPFMLCIYAIFKKSFWLYSISLLILLGFKESDFLIGIGIGIVVFFIEKTWRKIALATILFSAMWGFITIHIIIPAFSGGTYLYSQTISPNPLYIIASFFNNPIKLHTLFYTYLSFGFLPILSPLFWFLQFEDLFTRMYSNVDLRWGLGFHYSIMTAAIFSVSSLFSIRFLLRYIRWSFFPLLIGILLIGNAFFLYRYVLRAPFGLFYNSAFYSHTKDFAFLNNLVAKIPPTASITAQNNLASHFTHQEVWLLRSNHAMGAYDSFEQHKPQYILLDLRSGQNPNDFYGIDDLPFLYQSLVHNPHYHVYYHTENQYIFKRN